MRRVERGFTLIELLVVVALIGVLSAIVLASLNTARDKAANAKTKEVMHQYLVALSLYYAEYGSYPNPGDSVPHCLGNPVGDICGWSVTGFSTLPSAAVNTALAPFYPAMPVFVDIPVSGGTFRGPLYVCHILSNGKCTSAVLYWYLQGNGQNCNAGTASDDGPSTFCDFSTDQS